ncbi:hypothetical protein DIPPA_02976 [Diplonema papillatum]|nr:hypothetical protein DIPPA_02976 [Diplonema papillatum]
MAQVQDCLRGLCKGLLLKYHRHKTSNEVDLEFYAVTLDFKNPNLSLADLFSGFLCKEQVKWQAILLFLAVFNVFVIPYQMAIRGTTGAAGVEVLLTVLEIIGDVLFLLEVFVNFYLPFEEEGVQINIHKLIFHKYVGSWLVPDLVGAVPLQYLQFFVAGLSDKGAYLRVNKLVRFFRLNFYWGRMEKNLLHMNPSLIRLGKFIFLFILTAHWIACGWLEVARTGAEDNTQKWIGLHDFQDSDIWTDSDRYYHAFYWSLVTMVGYGGTVPQTSMQSAYSVAVVGIGVVMYVGVIGSVGTIVLNLDTAEMNHQQKLESINEFFRLRHVPPDLANKVRTYHDFMWRSRQGVDAIATVNDLPQYLRMEISSYVCKDMMSKVPLFQGADELFLRQLAASLRPLVCLPNTIVVTKGEMGKEMYFISKGSLEVLIEYETDDGNIAQKAVCVLKEGQHFGEIALLCRSKRSASIRTREYCDLFVLKAEDFIPLLLDNKEMSVEMRRHAMAQYPTLKEQLSAAFGHEDDDSDEDTHSSDEFSQRSDDREPDDDIDAEANLVSPLQFPLTESGATVPRTSIHEIKDDVS